MLRHPFQTSRLRHSDMRAACSPAPPSLLASPWEQVTHSAANAFAFIWAVPMRRTLRFRLQIHALLHALSTAGLPSSQGAMQAGGAAVAKKAWEDEDVVLTRLSTDLSDMDFLKACAQPVSALGRTAGMASAAAAAAAASDAAPVLRGATAFPADSNSSGAGGLPAGGGSYFGSLGLLSTGASGGSAAAAAPTAAQAALQQHTAAGLTEERSHEWYGRLLAKQSDQHEVSSSKIPYRVHVQ